MLSPDYLRSIASKVKKHIQIRSTVDSAPGTKGNPPEATALYFANAVAEDTIHGIDRAKTIVRSKDLFYKADQYLFAKNTLENAFSMISAGYFPFELRQNSISYGARLTFNELLRVASDETVNPFLEVLRDQIVPLVLPDMPPVVGISVTYLHQLYSAFTLARIVKTLSPDTHVVMGGSAVTPAEEQIRADPKAFDWVDSYVFGEGEGALAFLLDHIQSGYRLPNRLNKLFLRSDRETGRKPLSVVDNVGERENFNALPTPDYHGFNLSDYLAPETLYLLSSARGCYYRKCAFCNVSLAFNNGFRQRSCDRLFDDIRTLQTDYGARWLSFADDCVGPSRCREIAAFIQRLDKPLFWATEVRFEEGFTDALLEEMYRGGCRQLTFGNESASQRVLDLMHKNTRMSVARRIIAGADRAGIAVSLQNFLGFPGETPDEAEETVRFLLSEKEHISSWALGRFHVSENSPVQRTPSVFGITMMRRRRVDDLIPDYAFTAVSGPRRRDVARKHRDAMARLSRVYPNRNAFLDGPLGSHALFLLTSAGSTKIDGVFPVAAIPADVFAWKPRIKPSVSITCSRDEAVVVLQDKVTGKCCRFVMDNPKIAHLGQWLRCADGQWSIEQLTASLLRECPLDRRNHLKLAKSFVLVWLDLFQAGMIDTCDFSADAGDESGSEKAALVLSSNNS